MSDESLSGARAIVEIAAVSRRFGAKAALSEVSLAIPRGVVFGLLGTNGAGKTTLIKHVLGLLRPQAGSVAVFGLDPVAEPTSVLSRIGYLSELHELPEWMRVDELLRFTRAFYPTWDEDYAQSLRQTFELDSGRAVKELSKGQHARLGLVLALAHRPELLVLDEPSSGLDPLVRRDILRAIIRTIADEGRTVLFSSHLLDEVERVADHIAIIERGRIVENDSLELLKEKFHKVYVRFEAGLAAPPKTNGFFDWQGEDTLWSAFFRGAAADAESDAARLHAHLLERSTPSLEEIFVALVGTSQREGS
jgi:ABC-2 type transport system ATP-binding protein